MMTSFVLQPSVASAVVIVPPGASPAERLHAEIDARIEACFSGSITPAADGQGFNAILPYRAAFIRVIIGHNGLPKAQAFEMSRDPNKYHRPGLEMSNILNLSDEDDFARLVRAIERMIESAHMTLCETASSIIA
jgi:hypothetical protein